jgi:hypothetical protein
MPPWDRKVSLREGWKRHVEPLPGKTAISAPLRKERNRAIGEVRSGTTAAAPDTTSFRPWNRFVPGVAFHRAGELCGS